MKRDALYTGDEIFEIIRVKGSPCTAACPLGTNVKAYVSLIAAGRFDEALEVVRLTNPFPGICGRVCPHPCEDKCLRGDVDEPVSIAALKRFIADYELRRGIVPRYTGADLSRGIIPLNNGADQSGGRVPPSARTGQSRGRVAVIGAGPAGLTCAADLAREGCSVTVFEARPRAGGMLAYGIPAYRLPKDILDVEIAAIEAMGVEIKLNTSVGKHPGFEELVRQFDAVFIAAGAPKPRRLGIPGEEEIKEGLIYWDTFLGEASIGMGKNPGERVVIVGGGNTAVDCARVAVRLGARDVCILYRRSEKEMPAFREEVEEAEEEGIRFQFLISPLRLIHEDGRLVGVECTKMKLGPRNKRDKSGRRITLPVPGSEFFVPCDTLIPAVGQELDTSFLGEGHRVKIAQDNLMAVDPETLATSQERVFAGGDAVMGPGNILDAIAAGHRAARSILRYLSGLPPGVQEAGQISRGRELSGPHKLPPVAKRLEGMRISPDERGCNFNEVNLGLSEFEAVEEARRCLRCGYCGECFECVGVCEKKQLIMEPLSSGEALNRKAALVQVSAQPHRKLLAEGGGEVFYGSGEWRVSAFTARVDELLCRGCGLCEEVCKYRAIQVVYKGNHIFMARVNEDACRGCGTCVSVCPTGAIDQHYFNSGWIDRIISWLLRPGSKRSRDVIIACRWSDALEHLPGRYRNMVIQVMCLGSVGMGDILKAFERGAGSVTLLGCGGNRCHYGFGWDAAQENVRRVSAILSLLGFDGGRLRLVKAEEVSEELKTERVLTGRVLTRP